MAVVYDGRPWMFCFHTSLALSDGEVEKEEGKGGGSATASSRAFTI